MSRYKRKRGTCECGASMMRRAPPCPRFFDGKHRDAQRARWLVLRELFEHGERGKVAVVALETYTRELAEAWVHRQECGTCERCRAEMLEQERYLGGGAKR